MLKETSKQVPPTSIANGRNKVVGRRDIAVQDRLANDREADPELEFLTCDGSFGELLTQFAERVQFHQRLSIIDNQPAPSNLKNLHHLIS